MIPEFTTSMSCDSVILHVWCSLEQSLIHEADDQWPTRLRACVRAILNIHVLCDYQFVFSVLDEFYVSQ